ncbi:PAAR domain-containing protein [Massilia horti]|uniref:PAAR domain-containing protein n=1 Tax=Massilia horti TaxID=2562153 RepID=A0A4Y9SW99_9BURK|nr:PAAR domain-containing protein [Massilia horti]TFW31004.1 PAAR domain-containing protein [Massilia horti]
MRNVIRLGDSTSHGGQVVSVSAKHFTIDGIPVARVGDPCSCPIKGHDNCKIAEGDRHHTIDGIAVAYEGHKTTCGAVLIATSENFGGQ